MGVRLVDVEKMAKRVHGFKGVLAVNGLEQGRVSREKVSWV